MHQSVVVLTQSTPSSPQARVVGLANWYYHGMLHMGYIYVHFLTKFYRTLLSRVQLFLRSFLRNKDVGEFSG